MHTNDWANALSEFWGDREPGSRALLMLERSLLCEVASYIGESFESAEAAEIDFVETVKSYLRGKSHRTWSAEPFHPKGPHRFLLQIGIQVYAASKMLPDPDGKYTERAYHPQLDALLGEPLSKRRFNLNEQAEFHQNLWRKRLLEWVDHKQLHLTLPEDHGINRNHVQLPMSQMVFRENDLQQLPKFFVEAGFQPTTIDEGETFDENQIEKIPKCLRRLQGNSRCFSPWARNVLREAYKFDVAIAQIEDALRTWDGRVWLPPVRRRSERNRKQSWWVWLDLRLLQRRLRAVGGVSAFTAKTLATSVLELLFQGKETEAGDRLDFHEGLTLFAYDPEDAAFKQADHVDAGQKGILLSGPGHFANWNRVLDCGEVATIQGMFSGEDEEHWDWLAGLPEGCRVLLFQINNRFDVAESIPEPWRPFLRLPSARLSLSGGLRIGRGEHFVAGAGPQLTISGNRPPTFIRVDGEPERLDGRTVQIETFSEVGEHEIVARYDGKDLRKQFLVSRPKNAVSCEMPTRCWTFRDGQWPTWEAIETSNEGDEQANDDAGRLFGLRGVNLKAVKQSPTSPTDDRLTAIALLSGMPLADRPNAPPKHPLVRQLMMMQAANECDFNEVSP